MLILLLHNTQNGIDSKCFTYNFGSCSFPSTMLMQCRGYDDWIVSVYKCWSAVHLRLRWSPLLPLLPSDHRQPLHQLPWFPSCFCHFCCLPYTMNCNRKAHHCIRHATTTFQIKFINRTQNINLKVGNKRVNEMRLQFVWKIMAAKESMKL